MGTELSCQLGNKAATLTGVGTTQSGAAVLTMVSADTGANAWNLQPNSGNTAYVMDAGAPVGYTFMAFNPQSTTALIYPESGGTIQGGSANASYSIGQNITALFWKLSALTWVAIKTT
jgi:hypothetical protein